jgi:ABC-2 type transport system ATP-binding protein
MTIFFTTHYMEEAERFADQVAIIDHGSIIATGTPQELIARTETKRLEDAFIKLTGNAIRSEEASSLDTLRQGARAWGRK